MLHAWAKSIQKFLEKEFDIEMDLGKLGCVELK
jgi:hypothetical protein